MSQKKKMAGSDEQKMAAYFNSSEFSDYEVGSRVLKAIYRWMATTIELEKLQALWEALPGSTCLLVSQIPATATDSPFPGGDSQRFYWPSEYRQFEADWTVAPRKERRNPA